jgi:hypothetical protein
MAQPADQSASLEPGPFDGTEDSGSAPTDPGSAAGTSVPTSDDTFSTPLDTSGGDAAGTPVGPAPALAQGPLPQLGPAITAPLPGAGTSNPRVGGPSAAGGSTASSTQSRAGATSSELAISGPGWLRRLLPPGTFWAWLLELLPLVLQAIVAGLAALVSAWSLPPGGVVWQLPPELTHQLGAVGQAHAAMVQLADAALALIVALVGLGHLLGPRAGLPVLPPRELAPRLAVAVLVAHGSLAIGGWAINLHDALLLAVTPTSLAGWDPGSWTQGGPGGLLLGLLYAVLGLLLALGGWLRVALVDVLLVAAPVLAVLWVLPLTAEFGVWALRLFGNLLAGQWLQVLALWLGAQLLTAPADSLASGAAKTFAVIAVLVVTLRLPGLLPGPRGVGAFSVLFGFAVAGRAARSV